MVLLRGLLQKLKKISFVLEKPYKTDFVMVKFNLFNLVCEDFERFGAQE